MVSDALRPECPRCGTTFDREPPVGSREDAPPTAVEPLVGGSVTCDRCGVEFEVYFYR